MMYSVIFAGIAALLLAGIWLERRRRRRLERELDYIRSRIETILFESGREYIRIPTDSEAVRELSAEMNRFILAYYQALEEKESSQRVMQRMLTDISHDLKTPLTVLKGYAEILGLKAREGKLDEATGKIICKMEEKSGEAVHTIDQFFCMARIESGDGKPSLKRVELGKLVGETMLSLYDLLEQKAFETEIALPKEPVWVLGDEEGIARIIKNLVENAVKYAEDGKYMDIFIREEEDWASVWVTDHGTGIPKKERETIFLRNVSLGTGNRKKGTGLGLAIAKGLAVQMGGELSLCGDFKDGAAFVLRLKRAGNKKLEKS